MDFHTRESGSANVRAVILAESDDPELEGIAELIISKQRNGPIGTVPLAFLKAYTLFKDRADAEEPY